VAIQANANNALSARVVAAASNVNTVQVRYAPTGMLDNGAARTPAVQAASGEMTLPVLGLAPNATYDLQVTATTAAGETLSSPVMSFTTGALPAGLPTFSVADGGTAPAGYTLLAPVATITDGGIWPPAVIVDGAGNVVWYYELTGQLLDFQKQPDRSYTVAANGGFVQMSSLGDTLHTWSAASSLTDAHEVRIVVPEEALLFGYDERSEDLTQWGGEPNTPVLATTVQRVNGTGKPLFQWDPFDHLSIGDIDPSIPLTPAVPAGEMSSQVAVDWTHGNALDVADDGNYLVSYRDISTVLKLDSSSGDILWRLGGKESTFSFPDDPFGGPSMQHGIRELANGDIILFDNGNEHSPPQSRAVEYALDTTNNVAHLVWQYQPQPSLFAAAMGVGDRLPDGNTLVTFGLLGRVQEVSPEGQVLWDVSCDLPVYRALRVDSLY
jgi:hypothetical protein